MNLKPYFKTTKVVDLAKVVKKVKETYPEACSSNSMQVCGVVSKWSNGKLLGTGWTDEDAWLDALLKIQKMDRGNK